METLNCQINQAIILVMNKMKCNSCGELMNFVCYGYESECNTMDYGDKYASPIPLKCWDCGMNDWKHEHNIRYAVWMCENIDYCDNPDVDYRKDWTRSFDYSRIPFPHKGESGPKECCAYEVVFKTSRRMELKRLGKKLKIKEIDKLMKKVKRLFDKHDYNELHEMAHDKMRGMH